MRKHFSHCLLCGRVIPEGNVYCELCRRNAESNPLDPDRELVKTVKEGLRRTDGYCPCRREKRKNTDSSAESSESRWQIRPLKATAIACYITNQTKEIKKMLNITKASFDKEVMSSDIPVVLDFWAEWCGPCRMLSPVLEDLAAEYGDRVLFCKINVDDEPELAARFGIASIPTLLFFKNSAISKKSVGYRDKGELEKILRELL